MKTVFVVETNLAGNGVFAMRAAKSRGYHTHFLCKFPDDYAGARFDPIVTADRVSVVDTNDPIELARFLIDKDAAAVLSFDDFHVLPAMFGAVSKGLCDHEALGGVINCRYKDKTRRLTNGLEGLRPVHYALLDRGASTVSSPLGYPCVVKPLDESGSLGVSLCDDDAAFASACGEIRSLTRHGSGFRPSSSILVEEFIPGPEFSAEMIWLSEEGRWQVIGYSRKLVSEPPFRVEIGHVFPHRFGGDWEPALEAALIASLNAVGLRHTAAHVEFKLLDGRLALLEINPRLAGDMIVDLIALSAGIDIAELYLSAHLGAAGKSAAFREQSERYAAVRFLTSSGAGTVAEIRTGVRQSGVVEISTKPLPMTLNGVRSSEDRLGHVIAVSASPGDALAAAERQIASMELLPAGQLLALV